MTKEIKELEKKIKEMFPAFRNEAALNKFLPVILYHFEEALDNNTKRVKKEIMKIVSDELYTNGAIQIEGLNRINKAIK